MTVPAVSIVLPIYNGAHLVGDTVQTILAQDFSDFELLIINDGSTDHTLDVVGDISDPRIRIISLPQNRGIGFARNRGVQESTGEFIAFADADDHWKKNKLSKQVATLSQYPQIDLLFSDFENINLIDGISASGFSQTQTGLNVLQTQALSDTLFLIVDNAVQGLLLACFVATPTMIFRSELIDHVGNLRPGLLEAPDYEFVLRCAIQGIRFAFHTDMLVERYKTAQSVTAHPFRYATQTLDALNEFESLCLEHNRADIIPLINQQKYNLWRTQIRLHARMGNRKQAWHAFRHSISHGRPSPRAVFYLTAALAGPRVIEVGKRIRSRFVEARPH